MRPECKGLAAAARADPALLAGFLAAGRDAASRLRRAAG